MRFPTILLLLLLVGCADTAPQPAPVESQVGKNCIVFLRRDALGMAADLPASPTTGSMNGAEMSLRGELMEVGADWIVINLSGREFHIPKSSILLIEFGTGVIQTRRFSEEPTRLPHDTHSGDHDHH